jgi:translation initiation factor 2 gamma subunit (eIF-2gamma)
LKSQKTNSRDVIIVGGQKRTNIDALMETLTIVIGSRDQEEQRHE